ncbi:hypothetical protein A2803_04955 [Candidatus Woesebacteria bacterium RIFCSPHIGHO2_01_FULL_44_21]|uniref:SLC41A/MgtE integral membrane domain-containing protein n=1 Tax=Candidatus Woesebacteria bacterium RIFCSPHIGHO2_01_FULL_44_21 TaxID=1802503 RepID=A0A1F7Z1F0_9BACT|nr:MAG: hypothetical protein A2803_04955 [Candidatus Woesebacteria bacterium RIFCSPHIGHO2_01_FULL_44_21]OGM70003.1 MAG: hypothetical protein A2897_02360 [Candidatus Woesebacteria bacterium RIFCSPLOWO2_01_FULL_44_24b]
MEEEKVREIEFADDDTQNVGMLFRLRILPLVVGLFMGVFLSFAASRFEEVIAKNVSVAFFIPFIVYLAAAVGAQTQSIYIRDLKTGKASFKKYLVKESALGILFGLVFGLMSAVIVLLWFGSTEIAAAVSLALFCATGTAPLIALLVTEVLSLEHTDPAAGAGPIATAIQDTVSVLIYGFIASAIIL